MLSEKHPVHCERSAARRAGLPACHLPAEDTAWRGYSDSVEIALQSAGKSPHSSLFARPIGDKMRAPATAPSFAMLSIVQPDQTLARTKTRLDRHGPTAGVIAANAFDWASLTLHQSLLYILIMTLAVAILGRLGLTFLQIVLLLPLGYLLAIQPALRANRQTRRQIELHAMRHGVWKQDDASDD
jgi:hypothetical protein